MILKRRMKPLLGTYIEVSILHGDLSSERLNALFDVAFDTLSDVERRLSVHKKDSELSRLNLTPETWLPLSTMTLRILRLASAMMRQSNGLFNPTLGYPLVESGLLPDHGYGERLKRGSIEALSFRPGEVRLNENVVICLDGIAKGYAVDLALAALKRAGVESAFINAGGDIRAMGECRVPITLRYSNQPAGLLYRAAIASSATRHESAFRGRIMTATGVIMPDSNKDWSVIARRAWRADALTKVAAQTPADSGLLHRLGGNLLHAPSGEE